LAPVCNGVDKMFILLVKFPSQTPIAMTLQRPGLLAVLLLACCFATYAQATADAPTAYIGKWSGTFEGASSGTCALELTHDATGKFTGTLTVTPDGGSSYPITLKSVSVQGDQFKAAYDEPTNNTEVTMQATRTGDELKGTWQLGGDAANGTWQMKREK